MKKLPRWLAVAMAGATLIALACGGGDDKKSGGSTGGGQGGAAGTPGKDSAAATATVVPVGPSTAGCFAGVQRFRYTSTIALKAGGSQNAPGGDNIKASGSVVMPDMAQSKVEAGDQTIEVITIKEEVYTREGNGPWDKSSGQGGGGLNLKPSDLCQTKPADLEKAGIKGTKEKVNGVDAVKYVLDKKAITTNKAVGGSADALATGFENLTMTLWVTEKEQWPLKITVVGEQKGQNPAQSRSINIEFNVTDHNKSDITITAPKV